ncbi:hypothetical protein SI65_07250 [Aspergillus cristatus]|uniref:tyrosinase n=1 Tax=Aspergillus cristatus TaxID=573508 RepID=A0A1E3B9D8_ASPCR|nr:hypothetical protein SI65_07250 [Aspergillus cristatus]
MVTKPPSYPIKGINTLDPQGRRPVRKNIDDWYKEQTMDDNSKRIQLTLFVEALAIVQALPFEDVRSWFRIAGIHSQPWVAWDNASPPKGPKEVPKDRMPGYCVHNDYTFPTWHRVYVTLLEQVLYEAMNEFIDKNVPDQWKTEWQNEAKQWRLPYWDFARFANKPEVEVPEGAVGELRLPILLVKPNIEIHSASKNKTTVETKTVANPFYKYTAPKVMGKLDDPYKIQTETRTKTDQNGKSTSWTIPWDKCISTTKYGLLEGYHVDIWADGGQNWLRSNLALNEHAWNPQPAKPQQTVQFMTWKLLQQNGGPTSWTAFSSTRYCRSHDEKPEYWLSLEMIHNNIHAFVGGSQFIRPDEKHMKLWGMGHMASPLVAAFDPIFFIYHCNIDRLTAIWQFLNPTKWFDGDSASALNNNLLPFSKDDKHEIYKSEDVKDWRKLGYDYEILQGKDDHNQEHIRQVKKDIDTLYSKRTRALFPGLDKEERDESDYIITVYYNRYALNGEPYKINLFVGEKPKEDFIGPGSKNFVASIYSFSAPLPADGDGGCGNCKQQQKEGVRSVAQVPATFAVDKFADEDAGDPKDNVWFVVVDSLGQQVDLKRLGSPIEATLHRAEKATFLHEVDDNSPTDYEKIGDGKQVVYGEATTSFR